jgi:uncharacterized surface protein with fasciclin (FAS1) repeats
MSRFTILLLIALVVSVCAFAPSSRRFASVSALRMADIVDTAVGAGSFKTLAAALGAANLVSTLKGPGPFTVFAPTDAAFAKLPPGTVDSLLKDIPQLTSILTYHVVPGKVLASAVVKLDGQKVKTVQGTEVLIGVNSNGVTVDGAKVVQTDITCDNGVIHVIDTVILPKAPFDPKKLPGVSGPLGYFDPLGLAPDNAKDFKKMQENELKHGRVAMLAFVGILFGEKFGVLFGDSITGPAIFQYQQAEGIFNAWSANVIGLTLAIEGFNIVKGWEAPGESDSFIAGLKDSYTPGDLKFDPLGFKPKSATDLKNTQTKEINNGRLAMLGVAGIVAQELVTGQAIF